MILSPLTAVSYASETADLSAVSDATFLEEQETEEAVSDMEMLQDNEILDEFSNNENEEEVVFDESENDDTAEFLKEDSDMLVATYEDDNNDGYTALTENPDILYKYDDTTTTLYFKLAEGGTDGRLPNVTKPNQTSWWKNTKDSNNKSFSITCIDIGEGITSIGNYNFSSQGAFGTYKNVKTIKLPSTLTLIGEHAFDQDNLSTSPTYELVKKEINLSQVKNIGASAFSSNHFEKGIDLSAAIKIENKAFYSCSGLGDINFQADEVEIGDSAFASCTGLTSVTTKKLQINGENVFGSLGLQKFSCEKVNKFPASTFPSDELKAVCYGGTSEEWKENASDASLGNSVAIHCKLDKQSLKHANCTEDGVKIFTCEICGEEYTDGTVAPALGHNYAEDYTVDKVATCTEAGSESKHCNRCGEIEAGSEKEIPALGHDYVAEVTTQPTCTKDGVRTLTCSRCKDVKTETIPATGEHKWSDWKKTADATVFAAEQQERSCATCDKKETRTVGEKLAATATVSVSSVTLKEKQSTGTVKVTGLAYGDSITSWRSTNTKVFTVSGKADGTCKLTGVKKGNAELEITLASGLKKTVTVKVQAKTVTTSRISGLAKKMTVKKGGKTTLKPVITPATSQQKVTYSSSNKSVATVSSKGVITAKKAGTAKITVKSGSKKVTVTVTVPKTKTTAIKVGEKVSVKKGKTYSLKAKTTPSNSDEKITYSTSNKKIATVSKSGRIKGVTKGTATITIKSGKIVKKVKVTVK